MKIISGLTFKQTFSLPGFPASDGWAARAYLCNASAVYAIAANLFDGSGTDWELTIPAATTTSYAAGNYMLQIAATDGTDDLLALEVSVLVEKLASSARETRSKNQIILDNLDTVIAAKSSRDYASMSIDGRSINRMTWEEILKARAHYHALVMAERRAASGQSQIRNHRLGFNNG